MTEGGLKGGDDRELGPIKRERGCVSVCVCVCVIYLDIGGMIGRCRQKVSTIGEGGLRGWQTKQAEPERSKAKAAAAAATAEQHNSSSRAAAGKQVQKD